MEKEHVQLSFGLEDSFVDKNKHVKKNLAANLEGVEEKVTHSLNKEGTRRFSQILKSSHRYSNKNVYLTKDDIYHKQKCIINDDKTLAVGPGDKDSCVIIMRRWFHKFDLL